MSEKPTENIANAKTLHTFPVKSETRARKASLTSIEYCTEEPSQCNKAQKRKKRHPHREVKLALHTNDMVVYIWNQKGYENCYQK